MAAPFVQGRLLKKRVSVEIRTECGHCAHPMGFNVGSDLTHRIVEEGATPLVFEPEVDWTTFTGANITNAYCKNSLFFCSEEHARKFRESRVQIDGVYLTLDQSAYSTRIAQGALFAF